MSVVPDVKLSCRSDLVDIQLTLLDFPDDVIEAIEKSLISESTAEELYAVSERQEQSRLTELISKRHLSFRGARRLIREYVNGIGIDKAKYTVSDDTKVMRIFDKSIASLRSNLDELAGGARDVEENWLVYESLLQHRNTLHHQIDVLIRQKRKLARNSPR